MNNLPLKIVMLLFYGLFLGVYVYIRNQLHLDLFELFVIRKSGGSFLVELQMNINWFLFFFLVLVLPLDTFSTILLKISVFENIRKNQKNENYWFFLRTLFAYSFAYTTVHFCLFFIFGKTGLSLDRLLVLFLVSLMSIAVLLLIATLMTFFVAGYIGMMLSVVVVLLIFFWDQHVFILPVNLQMDSLIRNLVICTLLSVIFLLLIFWKYRSYELVEGV